MTEQQQTAVDRLTQIARDACAEQLAKSTIERVQSTHDAETYPWGVVKSKQFESSSVEVQLADLPDAADKYAASMRLLGVNTALTPTFAHEDDLHRQHVGEIKIVGTPFIQERAPASFCVQPLGHGTVSIVASWRGAFAYRPAGY